MSIENFDFEENRNATERTVTLTNKATYTVKVGTSANDLKADKVIKIVTVADSNDLTLTVPDGEFTGQRLIIILDTLADNEAITVTVTTGDTVTLDAEDEFVELVWIDSSIGWKKSRFATGV